MDVDQTLFEKELREILTELADTVSVESATIVPAGGSVAANDEDRCKLLPLGQR